jgi:iron complex outermembrane recepter protein
MPKERPMKNSCFFPLLGLAAVNSAYGEAPLEISAERVLVTATRFRERSGELPIGVTVITDEEIRQSTATSVPELLSQFAGIHVRDSTGSPNWQVDLRGFGITGDQNTLVLLDGQRLSEFELTTVKWSSIPLSSIERIEVLRGSGSVLYGGGATGGTINIITKAPLPNARAGYVHAGYGSYDTRDLRAGLSIAGEALGLAVNANQLESNNYRENNALRQQNVEADARYFNDKARVVLKFGSDDQDLELPGGRTEAQLASDRRGATTPLDKSTLTGGHASLGLSRAVEWGELAADIGYRDRRASAFFAPSTRVKTESEVVSFAPRLKLPHVLFGQRHSLIVGFDLDEWDYRNQFDAGPPFPFLSRASAEQKNRAVYLENSTELTRDTRLTLSGRLQRTENSIHEQVPLPMTLSQTDHLRAYEIALRHHLVPAFALYGKLGRSFRIATVDENRFQVSLLQPQTSHDRELGVEYNAPLVRARVSLFEIDLDDEIAFIPFAPPFGANINLPPTRRRGLELSAGVNPIASLELFANYTFVEAEFREGTFGGVDVSGNEVPLVPKYTGNLGGSWRFAQNTRLNWVIQHVGNQRFDNDQSNTFRKKMPSYTTADLKLTHAAGDWLFSGSIKNLFNEKYFSYGIVTGPTFSAFPEAERAYFASAEYRFR